MTSGRQEYGIPQLTRHAAQAILRADADHLSVSVLILQGNADRIVDPTAASEVASRLTCPHELVVFPGYYAELLNEPPDERARVLATLDRWLHQQFGG